MAADNRPERVTVGSLEQIFQLECQIRDANNTIIRLKSDLARLTTQKDWQWVPKETTAAMRVAFHNAKTPSETWAAMLAAAPQKGEGS